MKRILKIVCLAVAMMFVTVPGWADPVLGTWSYTAPTDTILAYENLATASQAQEEAWVAGILGYANVADFLAAYSDYYDDSAGTQYPSLNSYNPGIVGWSYALVKVDGPNDYTYLFRDDNGVLPLSLSNGDDLLTTPANNIFPFNMNDDGKNKNGYAISHIRFFGGTQQVPEPTTMLLFGLGLIGLAGLRKSKK